MIQYRKNEIVCGLVLITPFFYDGHCLIQNSNRYNGVAFTTSRGLGLRSFIMDFTITNIFVFEFGYVHYVHSITEITKTPEVFCFSFPTIACSLVMKYFSDFIEDQRFLNISSNRNNILVPSKRI